MLPRFLDTNILLRYFTRDDEAKARRALALLTRIEDGREKVITSPMVVFETVFTLERRYKVPKARIVELVLPIISLRGVELPGKSLYYRAFDLYVDRNISLTDAYNAAYMEARKVTETYSFDRDFDRIDGLTRVEPEEDAQDLGS